MRRQEMSHARSYRSQGAGVYHHDDRRSSYNRNGFNLKHRNTSLDLNGTRNNFFRNKWSITTQNEFSGESFHSCYHYPDNNYHPNGEPSIKRRKISVDPWGDRERCYSHRFDMHENAFSSVPCLLAQPLVKSTAIASTSVSCRRDPLGLLDDEPIFMSRDEIDRCSPSRRDGIDAYRETHLRYSYCAFLQDLGIRLDLPQTTIGTAMVLCHRFFMRRSHACHDRFLISSAALFLAAKSEETPRPLNNVLRVACEIFHRQDISFLSFVLPVDWFEQYRERVIEAEHMILSTLNFDLNVQHPYDPLTSVLEKLGLSQTVLVNLALNLVSEGLRSSLWLQFKPQHIAAGAAYLAAKLLCMDLAPYRNIWDEFGTTHAIIHDVSQQLMELL